MADSKTGGIPQQASNGAPSVPTPAPPPQWATASVGFGDNGHRGDFGEQFIRMLAAAANIDATKRERDRVGVDWQLGHPGRSGTRRYPVIEAQVKCTSSPDMHTEHIAYPLKMKNFNMLAGRDFDIPRFLFLVLAPLDPFAWSHADPDRLLLRHAAYWVCLHDQDPLEDRTSGTRTVHVPRAHLLTVGSLHDLFAEDYRDMLVAS
ncbi:DUF4365 domain-containing protein [Streptomyces odontomachi]|uniref:DUF4365 domain-containing protein n=1 Tax=Streptomyces odontomachi TaxID=2944940 RepID=UPI002109D0F1|nr:DUF4365 domain-containing protein [Streptomyces sp. ODS25]